MRLVVPDDNLMRILSSGRRLQERWPGNYVDAMLLIQTLELAGDSLAEVLDTGLVSVQTPGGKRVASGIAVAHRLAVLRGVAHDDNGAPVKEPHARLARVRQLTVLDVAVAGVSAERRVG